MNQLDEAFRTLRLEPGLTFPEAKTRFRNLVKRNHPDKFPGANEKERAERFLRKVLESFDTITAHFKAIHGTSCCNCTPPLKPPAVKKVKPLTQPTGQTLTNNSSATRKPAPQAQVKQAPKQKKVHPGSTGGSTPRRDQTYDAQQWRAENESRRQMHDDIRNLYFQSVKKKRGVT